MTRIDDFLTDATERMSKSVDATHDHFNSVRTGRASAALLDRIQIDYYGTPSPLKNIATISVPEPRLLTIQPFDPTALKQIERAIQESDLGLTPANDGKVIRLPIPQPTEERRKDLVKTLNHRAEEGRIAIRTIREEVWKAIQELEKSGDISEDDKFQGKDELQKMIDGYNEKIESIRRKKEEEILTV